MAACGDHVGDNQRQRRVFGEQPAGAANVGACRGLSSECRAEGHGSMKWRVAAMSKCQPSACAAKEIIAEPREARHRAERHKRSKLPWRRRDRPRPSRRDAGDLPLSFMLAWHQKRQGANEAAKRRKSSRSRPKCFALVCRREAAMAGTLL